MHAHELQHSSKLDSFQGKGMVQYYSRSSIITPPSGLERYQLAPTGHSAIPYPEGAAPKPWPRCLVPKVPINSSVSAKKKQFNGQAKAGYGDGKEEDNIKSNSPIPFPKSQSQGQCGTYATIKVTMDESIPTSIRQYIVNQLKSCGCGIRHGLTPRLREYQSRNLHIITPRLRLWLLRTSWMVLARKRNKRAFKESKDWNGKQICSSAKKYSRQYSHLN